MKSGEGQEVDRVVNVDSCRREHFGIEAAMAGVAVLADMVGIAILEAGADVSAGLGVGGDFEDGGADAELLAGGEARPVEAGEGEVFAGRAGGDGVAIGLELLDDFEREEANGAGRAAVVFEIALLVAGDVGEFQSGAGDGELRHAARRIDVDLI